MGTTVNDTTVTRWTGTPSGTTAITSASFTPANNSLLLCCVGADEAGDTSNVEITVSGGSLTWTQQIKRGSTEANVGLAAIWTAPVSTGASMTCSVARTTNAGNGGSNRITAKLYIITGQNASPIGASNSVNFTTDPQNLSLTTTGAGRLFGSGWDGNSATAGTSSDVADAAGYAGAGEAIAAYKSADHTSGTSQSINFNPPATPTGNLVILEILAGGSDVSASLTGQSATGSAGTLGPQTAKALSGSAITSAQGAIAAALSMALTGQSVTSAPGTLTPAVSITLAGASAAFAQGTVTPSTGVTVQLTGQAATFVAGTLTPALAKVLGGLSGTFATGTVTPSSGVTIALVGQAAAFSGGTLGPTLSAALSGLASSLAQGTLIAAQAKSLAGQSFTGAAGTLSPSLQIALTGNAVMILQGTLFVGGALDVRMKFTARIERHIYDAAPDDATFTAAPDQTRFRVH